MYNTDLAQLAILWSILGLSVVCAINAHGLFRHLISWFIIIAIAVVAVFLSYMKFEDIKQATFGKAKTSALSNSAEISASNDSANANCLSAEKQLVDEAIVILDSIISFPKWKYINLQGIEKRETFENKALFLRNRSTNAYRQIRDITPQSEKKEVYDSLLEAAENLRLAGYEVHQQFGEELDSSGENIDMAHERAGIAKTTISNIKCKE